jgi:hypothetical protein
VRIFEWTETTPKWNKPNPFRRYEAYPEMERLMLERNEGDKGRWYWAISTYGLTCELPGGDLPDDDAKRLAPIHLANQLRMLLEALS